MLGWLKDHSKRSIRSKGANRFEYWYVPISLLLPAIGVLESWAALEIVVGPKPYPTNAPQRGATRPERQIHRLQKRQIGRLAAALPKFGGLWRSWQAWRYMEGYFGERERLRRVRKGYEVCSWGQLRQLPRTVSAKTRDSQCLQTDRLRQPALQSTEIFWKKMWKLFVGFTYFRIYYTFHCRHSVKKNFKIRFTKILKTKTWNWIIVSVFGSRIMNKITNHSHRHFTKAFLVIVNRVNG